jgi:hypothetical protein
VTDAIAMNVTNVPSPIITPRRESPFASPLVVIKEPNGNESSTETVIALPGKKLDLSMLQEALEAAEDNSDKYTFTLMVHCGISILDVSTSFDNRSDIPPTQADVLPSPFVTAKTTMDAKEKRPAKAATFAATSCRNVIWHERLAVDIEKEEAQKGVGLFLSTIDSVTKKYLGKCIIPVDNLIFGEQYLYEVIKLYCRFYWRFNVDIVAADEQPPLQCPH